MVTLSMTLSIVNAVGLCTLNGLLANYANMKTNNDEYIMRNTWNSLLSLDASRLENNMDAQWDTSTYQVSNVTSLS